MGSRSGVSASAWKAMKATSSSTTALCTAFSGSVPHANGPWLRTSAAGTRAAHAVELSRKLASSRQFVGTRLRRREQHVDVSYRADELFIVELRRRTREITLAGGVGESRAQRFYKS